MAKAAEALVGRGNEFRKRKRDCLIAINAERNVGGIKEQQIEGETRGANDFGQTIYN